MHELGRLDAIDPRAVWAHEAHGFTPWLLGIDLTYYGNQGVLEYDFTVAPGADPKAIRLRFFRGVLTTACG